jgi:flagellar FliL protein
MSDKKADKKEEKKEDAKVEPSLDGASAAEGAGEGAEGEGKKGLNAKKILIIVVPIILLLAIGAGLYFTGTIDKILGKKTDATAEAGREGEKGKDGKEVAKNPDGTPVANAFFLEIPNMMVNLSSPDGQARYLRLSVQIELGSDEDKKAVEAVLPRVVDQFQTYLRELRVKDLRGSAGIYRLQTELLNRVNAAAYPVEVKDVLFQEILIQ